MQMHPLAIELNEKLQSSSQVAYACLSETGQKICFPAGILKQAGEAKEKASRFNATIGIAVEDGEPMYLDSTLRYFNHLSKKEIYAYAPPDGVPELRTAWKEKMVRDNPTLANKAISLPVVTAGLTHGLSLVNEMFVDPGDVVILPDKIWGTYGLIISTRLGGRLSSYPLFDEKGGFNVQGLADVLQKEAASHKKLIILLNTPNNPTGYTPTPAEAQGIFDVVRKQAETGTRIVTLSDDAYFGLFYEDSVKESLFSGFCDLHENVLAVKLDAATKENFAWGFRTGFVTYGTVTSSPDVLYPALEIKTKGMLRASISSNNHASQQIIRHLLEDPTYNEQIQAKNLILRKRALRLKEVLSDNRFENDWEYYPFNSGYFMCLKLYHVNADELRLHLLDNYQIGTIAINETDLRIAFSSVDEADMEELVSFVHKAVKELS